MDWLMLHSKGILRGSLAIANHSTQLIWIKLLAMANEARDRDGYLRYSPGKPYPFEYIAQTCNVTMEQLNNALAEFECDVRNGHQRIEFAEDGSIQIMNWRFYQTVPAKPEKRISRSEAESEGITRAAVNKRPHIAIDTIEKDFNAPVPQSVKDKVGYNSRKAKQKGEA